MNRLVAMLATALAAAGLLGWTLLANRPSPASAEQTVAAPKEVPAKAEGAEAGIKAITAEYVKAFNAGDAKTCASLWTATGEYAGSDGEIITGRADIEKSLAAQFKANPKATVEIRVESVKVLGRGLANALAVVSLKQPGDDPVVESRYSALHVLEDGVWRVASVREWVPDPATDVTVKHLEWLVGDWTSKGPAGEVKMTYAWDETKTFLTGKYSVTKDGKTVSSGTQVFGRNPSGGLRSWMFDSSGTTSDGLWTRDEGRWINEASGMLPDGTEVSSVSVLIPLGPDSFTWQTTEREVNGAAVAPLPPVKVTRVKK